jgi:transposase
MLPVAVSDAQWRKILPLLRAHPNVYVGQEQDCRLFLSAVLWITRSGAQWRLLPKEYGNWNAVYRRFARWAEQGVFEHLHQTFADDADMEHLLIDSTVIRAHPCAAGASKKAAAKRRRR